MNLTPGRARIAERSILGLGTFVFLFFWAHTNPPEYGVDFYGHAEYIRYVASHWALPSPDQGHLFYHAPLYYTVAAIVLTFARMLDAAHPMQMVRLVSIVCYVVFLYYSSLSLRLLIKNRFIYLISLILLIFWPYGIVLSSRIDSNVMLYAFCGVSFYHLLRWHRFLHHRDLVISLLSLAFAIMTRSNALIMAAVIFIVVLQIIISRKITTKSLLSKYVVWSLVYVLIAVGINIGRNVHLRLTAGHTMPFIVGNSDHLWNIQSLILSNRGENYASFDYEKYFAHPFHSGFEEKWGRRNFWVVLFKSMNFGEYTLSATLYPFTLNVLLLMWISYIIFPLFFVDYTYYRRLLPCLALAMTSITALMINRWQIPIAASGDFRYAFFSTTAMCIIFGNNLIWLKKRRFSVLYAMGCILAISYPILSAMAYLERFF